MYFPPLKVLKRIRGTLVDEDSVKFPRIVFEAFLRRVFTGPEFDAQWYRLTYPDVADAIKRGLVPDEITHFVRFGYFEDRKPRNFDVDLSWYTDNYIDVGDALRQGRLSDVRSHFNNVGYFEPRAPDPVSALFFAELLDLAAGVTAVAPSQTSSQDLGNAGPGDIKVQNKSRISRRSRTIT